MEDQSAWPSKTFVKPIFSPRQGEAPSEPACRKDRLGGEPAPTHLIDLAYGTPSDSRRFLRSASNSFWTDV